MGEKKADNLSDIKSEEKSVKTFAQQREQVAEHKPYGTVALFAAALANGLVPKTENPALFSALSLLGNNAFARALTYRGEREAKLRLMAEQNEFSDGQVQTIASELDKQAPQSENRFSGLPEPSAEFTAPLAFDEGTKEPVSALALSDFGSMTDSVPDAALQ